MLSAKEKKTLLSTSFKFNDNTVCEPRIRKIGTKIKRIILVHVHLNEI